MVATLSPQPGVRAGGRVVVDVTSGETAILISGLAPAPAGKTYELWAIRGDRAPEPAGLFSVVTGDWVAMRMPSVVRATEVTAFAVSIEPAGGSTTPTGPIVLSGAVMG